MKSGIYRITNSVTGMFYIGSAIDLKRRRIRHFSKLRTGNHPNHFMLKDFAEHGEASFLFEIVEYCDDAVLLEREQFWIDQTKAAVVGYNIALSAFSPMKGRKQSEATRAKMREAHRNRKPISEETRQRMRDASKKREAQKKAEGFTVSEETRQKLREAAIGREVTEETREKLRKTNSRPKQTPAELAAIEALKGVRPEQMLTDEARQKHANAMRERWQDPEFKARMKASMKGAKKRKSTAK